MRSRAALLAGGAFLAALVSAVPLHASVSVYYIQGSVDSLWMADGPTQYHGTNPFPAQDTFSGSYLSGTWTGGRTSEIYAPTGSALTIGSGLAHGRGQYSGTISSTAFSFTGSGFAETELDTGLASPTQLAAEGAASMVVYFVVPAGPGVTATTTGSIGLDPPVGPGSWWPTAEYRISQVFPSAPSTTLLSKRSGSWTNESLTLGPGTYRIDYYVTSTFYPAYPSSVGASYVYSDDFYPEYFSAEGTMNVSTSFVPVPEPTIGFALAVVSSSVLLRPRRKAESSELNGGRDE